VISTYDLDTSPSGWRLPHAWLRTGGEVACIDLAVQDLTAANVDYLEHADAVAFLSAMHTATRIAAEVIKKVRRLTRRPICALWSLRADERGSTRKARPSRRFWAGSSRATDLGDLSTKTIFVATNGKNGHIPKLKFRVPDRSSLLDLGKYGFSRCPMEPGAGRIHGSEQGLQHMCRHCPIVPVYDGQFRVVQQEIVMADVDQFDRRGRGTHPFAIPISSMNEARVAIFNGPSSRHPDVTYDVTISSSTS